MTATETDAPEDGETSGPDGTEYVNTLDYRREVVYKKDHADGRTTQVHIEDWFVEWGVYAVDRRGDEELAYERLGTPVEETKSAAKALASGWMKDNPQGVAR